MKCLLVTIAIGDRYLERYYNLFYESQKNYALKNNYDFKVITDYLDPDPEDRCISNITMNKFLLCNQKWSSDYDFIIFVDADILININAPSIHNYLDYEGLIGVVNEYSQPSNERRLLIQKKMGWETSASDYYKLSGFNIQTDMVFNSGMQVLQPKIHADFLQNIYNKYIKQSKNKPERFHFEQRAMGYEFQKNNLYKVMDNRFNAIWALTKLDNIKNITLNEYFKDNFFVHFASYCDFDKIKYIEQESDLSKYINYNIYYSN